MYIHVCKLLCSMAGHCSSDGLSVTARAAPAAPLLLLLQLCLLVPCPGCSQPAATHTSLYICRYDARTRYFVALGSGSFSIAAKMSSTLRSRNNVPAGKAHLAAGDLGKQASRHPKRQITRMTQVTVHKWQHIVYPLLGVLCCVATQDLTCVG